MSIASIASGATSVSILISAPVKAATPEAALAEAAKNAVPTAAQVAQGTVSTVRAAGPIPPEIIARQQHTAAMLVETQKTALTNGMNGTWAEITNQSQLDDAFSGLRAYMTNSLSNRLKTPLTDPPAA